MGKKLAKKAIIFDFDGVIIESIGPRFKFLQKAAAKRGIDLSDRLIKELDGYTTTLFLSKHVKDSHIAKQIEQEYRTDFQGNILQYITPIADTVDFIRNYQGQAKLALGSMAARSYLETITKHLSIFSQFDVILSRNEISNHKPHPETYLTAASTLHLKPDECIVIEDTPVGAQAALNAHIDCYINLHSYNHRDNFKGMKIMNFIESKEDWVELQSLIE